MQTETLETRINRWKWGVAGFGVILIAAYFWYFGVKLEQPAAENAEKWGQFGDFVGGLLNPMVAFAAFYWLTQSVKLQKTELAETRKALEGAEEAQKKQAENSDKSVRIAALAAMVSAIQTQITAKDLEISSASAMADSIMRDGKAEAAAGRELENYLNTRRNSATNFLPEAVMTAWKLQKDSEAIFRQEKKNLRQELDYYLKELTALADASIPSNRSPL